MDDQESEIDIQGIDISKILMARKKSQDEEKDYYRMSSLGLKTPSTLPSYKSNSFFAALTKTPSKLPSKQSILTKFRVRRVRERLQRYPDPLIHQTSKLLQLHHYVS